jgi:tungstate transport system ATP-binding protein
LRSLRKSYRGTSVLDIGELTLGSGEVLALTGPNGAGKSTLLRIIGLLEAPDRADLFQLLGVNAAANGPALRRRIGIVFQEPFVFRGTALDNLTLGLRWRGLPRPEIDRRIRRPAELLGLENLDKPARALSRGQAQRLVLARSLALEPELLLLDEPLNALDAEVRTRLLKDLKPLLTTGGRSTIYVTHDQDEAKALTDWRLRLAIGSRP